MILNEARNSKLGRVQVSKIYLGTEKVWDIRDAQPSCFSLGYWIMKEPWLMYKTWKMNKEK